MPECEFKDACEIGFLKKYGGKCTIPPEEHEACLHYVTLHQHFNSPQFKKQSEEKIRKAIDDFREELVAQIKEDCKISVFGGSTVEYVRLGYLLNVILKHRLEE